MPAADDLLFTPVRELAARVKDRRVSPVDLAELSLARLEKYGPRLGAVVTLCRERALAEAKAAEQEINAGKYRGPLHGIPYGVKDLLATKGIPTTWGAAPFRNQMFEADATVVRKLGEAGAVLTAKLAMVELAGGFGYDSADASFTGPARCPWDTAYWAGGSSSGSGAAVAAGLVSFAIGSETSGSIITPAAYSGVTGLRPTYGRVSLNGAMALCWSLDKLGPMGRTADDCGIVLAAIAGADPADPSSVEKPFAYPPPAKRFRLGVVDGALDSVQPSVGKNFRASLKVLKEFCDVADEEVPLPNLPFGAVVGTIVSAEGAAAFRELLESGKAKELQNAKDRWAGYEGLFVPAVDYIRAQQARGPMKRAMAKTYAGYDALIAPARATVSVPADVPFAGVYAGFSEGTSLISAGNAVGQPAVSVLNGFGERGLPTGIQFTGAVWSEPTLLAIAAEYQRRTDWHTKRPPLKGA
jgi:aspartyl-tRNA(Asn)/glutamyl-tRNA(Gln) amidotransferase subunit A